MRFWQKLFGGGHSLEQMRVALAQKRWADAVNIGTDLEHSGVAPQEQSELKELLFAAGDGLASLNLSEGEACLRAGDLERANEHFNLAASQARSADLRQRISEAISGFSGNHTASQPRPLESVADCHAGCSSACSVPEKKTGSVSADIELDEQTRLELLLATYPGEWAERYSRLHGPFLQAFLLAHEGNGKGALLAFDAVDEKDRDDLFYFERGSLFARHGETNLAVSDLDKALTINPSHFPAFETLVLLELSANRESSAELRLQRMLSHNTQQAFCYAQLARILFGRGEREAALSHALKALSVGDSSPESLVFTASLLEQSGQIDAAEQVLLRIPGGGCNGSPNLALAELWLRYGKNLDKVLESFKAAIRSEPDNPRWRLRVAQVYLARGWKKDAILLLEKVLASDNLEAALRVEATEQLAFARA